MVGWCNIEPTPLPRGPAVIIHNPNVIFEKWKYLRPGSEESLQAFPSRHPEAIAFGPDHRDAYVVWREGGFDIVWINYYCSTQPVLRIKEATIEVWLNDGIWDDCESAGAGHAFKVELESNIPPEEWTYILEKDVTP